MKYLKEYGAAIMIMTLLLSYAQLSSVVLLVVAYIIAILNITKLSVILPIYLTISFSPNYFVIFPGFSSGLLFNGLAIISLLLNINSSKQHASSANYIVPLAVFLAIYLFISSILSITESLISYMLFFESIIVVILVSFIEKFDLQKLIKTITILSFLTAIFLFIQYLRNPFSFDETGRYKLGELNPNRFSMLCEQISAVLIFYFLYTNKLKVRILIVSGIFITLFLILLSGTRSALFASFIAFVFMLFMTSKFAGKSLHYLLPICILLLLLYVGWDWFQSSDMAVIDRFNSDSIEKSAGAGRFDRMDELWNNVFPNYPIFGVGYGGENEYAVCLSPAHNIIFDSLIQLGIIGFPLFWFIIYRFVIKCFILLKSKEIEILFPLTIFLAAFSNGIGEVVFGEKFFWNGLALCILFSNVVKYNNLHVILSSSK